MKLLQRIDLNGCIQAINSSIDGKQVAVAVGTDRLLAHYLRQQKCVPAVHWLSLGAHGIADEFVEVAAQRKVLASHILEDRIPNYATGLYVTARYTFVGTQASVVCLDSKTLGEICRTEEFTDEFDPLQEDLMGEESLRPGGFVWDEGRKRLFTLMGHYNAGVVFCYTLDIRRKRLKRLWKREVVATRPTRQQSELLSAQYCRVAPDGKRVAATFLLEDLQLDRDGMPCSDYDAARKKAEQTAKRGQRRTTPKTARLGWLGLFDESSDQWIELTSDIKRDFDGGKREEVVGRKRITTGYSFCTWSSSSSASSNG